MMIAIEEKEGRVKECSLSVSQSVSQSVTEIQIVSKKEYKEELIKKPSTINTEREILSVYDFWKTLSEEIIEI